MAHLAFDSFDLSSAERVQIYFFPKQSMNEGEWIRMEVNGDDFFFGGLLG